MVLSVMDRALVTAFPGWEIGLTGGAGVLYGLAFSRLTSTCPTWAESCRLERIDTDAGDNYLSYKHRASGTPYTLASV